MKCYRDEDKCTAAATHSTEKGKLCLGHPLLSCKGSSAPCGQTEARGWEGDAAESSRSQTAFLGSWESLCSTVTLRAESRNVTSSQKDFSWTYQPESIKSWLKHHSVGRVTGSSSSDSFGHAGALHTLLCSYGKSTPSSQRVL